jgi:hypothetical protein
MKQYHEDYRHLNFDQMMQLIMVVEVLLEDNDDFQLLFAIDQEMEELLELL